MDEDGTYWNLGLGKKQNGGQNGAASCREQRLDQRRLQNMSTVWPWPLPSSPTLLFPKMKTIKISFYFQVHDVSTT